MGLPVEFMNEIYVLHKFKPKETEYFSYAMPFSAQKNGI